MLLMTWSPADTTSITASFMYRSLPVDSPLRNLYRCRHDERQHVTGRPDWMSASACGSGEYPVDWWFPEPHDKMPAFEAKRVCKTACPVRAECEEYATVFPTVLEGIWGGHGVKAIRHRRHARGIRTITDVELTGLPSRKPLDVAGLQG